MKPYLVKWEIDIDADSPREAAEKAFEIQQRPGSTANAFVVYDKEGRRTLVDLEEEEDDCES